MRPKRKCTCDSIYCPLCGMKSNLRSFLRHDEEGLGDAGFALSYTMVLKAIAVDLGQDADKSHTIGDAALVMTERAVKVVTLFASDLTKAIEDLADHIVKTGE